MSPSVTALVTSDALAVMFDLDQRRPYACGRTQTRPQRSGIPVRLHLHASLAVHNQGKQNLVNGKAFLSDRHKIGAFGLTRFADWYLSASNNAASACQAGRQ